MIGSIRRTLACLLVALLAASRWASCTAAENKQAAFMNKAVSAFETTRRW